MAHRHMHIHFHTHTHIHSLTQMITCSHTCSHTHACTYTHTHAATDAHTHRTVTRALAHSIPALICTRTDTCTHTLTFILTQYTLPSVTCSHQTVIVIHSHHLHIPAFTPSPIPPCTHTILKQRDSTLTSAFVCSQNVRQMYSRCCRQPRSFLLRSGCPQVFSPSAKLLKRAEFWPFRCHQVHSRCRKGAAGDGEPSGQDAAVLQQSSSSEAGHLCGPCGNCSVPPWGHPTYRK